MMWNRPQTPPSNPSLPGIIAVVLALLATSAGVARSQASDSPGSSSPETLPGDTVPAGLEDLASEATRAAVLLDVRTPSGSRQGSGFLVSSDGKVLTNSHVIRNAESVRVKLASGDAYEEVSILADDERRDIAVLQIPGFELPSLSLGNSDSLRIGSSVILVGSPLGLENTVSTGIVSGRRSEPEGFQLFQLTAPASQGSSGGAVLSTAGEVVGIAVSQMRGGQNLNFAVPINYARGILSHLDSEPVAVLKPTASASGDEATVRRTAASENRVNLGLGFELESFGGYTLETETRTGENRWRRTRTTYRRIETVGSGVPRIERDMESETTTTTGPFDNQQVRHRHRSRTLVRADDLEPISTRGEEAWWTGETWKRAEYDLEFSDYRVRGLIRDTTGQAQELDRDLPPGIIVRDVQDLAFGTLDADSLVGRSVELVIFDPRTGEVATDRFDVEDTTSVQVVGETFRALDVRMASGLSSARALYRSERPRVLLRKLRDGEGWVGAQEVTSLEFHPPPGREP